MSTHDFEGFYFGVVPDLDVDESNYRTENAASFVGTVFGTVADPAYLHLVNIAITDQDNDGISQENDFFGAPDSLIYNGSSQFLDSVAEYAVTLTFADGSTATAELELLQDVSGRLFITPFREGRPGNAVLDDGPIVSISFDFLIGSRFNGTVANPEPNAFVTCFVAGTMLETPAGPVDIARLRAGDVVSTVDAGPQKIVVATRCIAQGMGTAAPVRITAGALGPGIPDRNVEISRQHRVLVASAIAERVFAAPEVLVRAMDLVGLPGIDQAERPQILTYHHVLTPQHQLLVSQGMISESLWPGPMALGCLTDAQRRIARRLYPRQNGSILAHAVRPLVQGRACRDLVDRHRKHGKPLQPSQRHGLPGNSDQMMRTWVPMGAI